MKKWTAWEVKDGSTRQEIEIKKLVTAGNNIDEMVDLIKCLVVDLVARKYDHENIKWANEVIGKTEGGK